MQSLIETKNVSKFVKGTPIVYRLNLEIPKGTLYGLLGPNGAGKSSTLKLLTGRIKPTNGMIRVMGLNPWKERVELNRHLGYLPQNPTQHQEKSILDFLKYMARLRGYNRSEAIKEARESLHQVGLGRMEDNIIGKLSGGEKQRLGFANALLDDPDILLLDEPTASLDPEGRIYVMDLINKLSQDKAKTIIISSHILPEIKRMTNYVAIMSEGTVLTSGNIHELTKNIFDNQYVIRSDQPDKLSKLLKERNYDLRMNKDRIFIQLSDLDQFWSELPSLCAENNLQLRSMKPMRDSLERLFMNLVSEDNTGKVNNNDE